VIHVEDVGLARHEEVGHRGADRRRLLDAVAGEPARDEEVLDAGFAEDRVAVRRVRLEPAPAVDHVQFEDLRNEPSHLLGGREVVVVADLVGDRCVGVAHVVDVLLHVTDQQRAVLLGGEVTLHLRVDDQRAPGVLDGAGDHDPADQQLDRDVDPDHLAEAGRPGAARVQEFLDLVPAGLRLDPFDAVVADGHVRDGGFRLDRRPAVGGGLAERLCEPVGVDVAAVGREQCPPERRRVEVREHFRGFLGREHLGAGAVGVEKLGALAPHLLGVFGVIEVHVPGLAELELLADVLLELLEELDVPVTDLDVRLAGERVPDAAGRLARRSRPELVLLEEHRVGDVVAVGEMEQDAGPDSPAADDSYLCGLLGHTLSERWRHNKTTCERVSISDE
jgi:hypothetical protein